MSDDGSLSRSVIEDIVRGILTSIFGGRVIIDRLVAFARTPVNFLRVRVVPIVVGGIFGVAFDIARIIARPFDAVLASLGLVNESISTATAAITDPIGDGLSIGTELVLSVTAPLGPLQPFVVTGLTIAIAYVVVLAGIRLARALADSVPVLSGVETFLFG